MTTAVHERTLPHSIEAERSVLGAILIDNEAFPIAASVIDARAFFRDAHRRIFERLTAMAEQYQPMDLVTLREALERSGEVEEVGGPVYLGSLIDGVPRATNVEYYARIVKEKATLRKLIFAANRILSDAYEADQDADRIVDEAEAQVMAVGRQSVMTDFVLADDWRREIELVIDQAISTRQIVTGVPTGFSVLDGYTRGWQPADLIYIGGRPSDGKTALMLQMADAATEHCMTGICSLEMKRASVGQRYISMLAQVDLYRLMTGHLADHEQQRIGHALHTLAEKRLAIDDASGLTAMQLRAKIRRLAARYGLGIVFIDYLQLIQAAQKSENRNVELAGISASLKGLAKDLNIPVVVLSQFSREVAKQNRRPVLSDLRDSGSLEQDADVVLLIHRPEQKEDQGKYQDEEKAELILAKQRNGPRGTVHLQWFGSQVRFMEKTCDLSQPTLAGTS